MCYDNNNNNNNEERKLRTKVIGLDCETLI